MKLTVAAAVFVSWSMFGFGAAASTAISENDEQLTEDQMMQIDGVPTVDVLSLAAPKMPNLSASDKANILAKYSYLDPQKLVPSNLLETAIVYYESNYAAFPNHSYLAVIDYSARSTKERFFVVNLKSGEVKPYHAAHGKGSDSSAHNGYADKFGNAGGSSMSSLGFARTDVKTYVSVAHESTNALRLIGLSSTDSNMYARAVVIHGAKYVYDENVVQGRSAGCPALSLANVGEVTALLEGGALVYLAQSAK